ncbi:N-succinyl-L-ornithine transcarbamylase [Marivirga sericea]|uniref:N-succinylornithine carbamoyltransferase n=1 Tax=Marivirga sericea TaxID=1028 RepID=A0A1X7KY48_9BACT|nr:acetylornithine carbamoyltransferase [Marivirga sericea]SMG46154.1 N-succinyl-L-ornithine transcarbamylase [Marivirga sericea]
MKNYIKFDTKYSAEKLIISALQFKENPFLKKEIGKGLRIGLIFLNPSLRTRVSTQIAANNLGMEAIVFNIDKEGWALEFEEGVIMNENKAEHIKEAASVLGGYFDILAIRAFPTLIDKEQDMADKVIHQFIKYSQKPVVSLESSSRHPLQSLADMMSIEETWQKVSKPKIVLSWAPHVKALPHAVPNSFAEWALGLGHNLTITQPDGYELDAQFTKGAAIEYDQEKAVADADFVYVKNWSSYHDYGKLPKVKGKWLLKDHQLKENAKIMHCLPVRRNLELADELLDGNKSLVPLQAQNRIYAAQAVLFEIISNMGS